MKKNLFLLICFWSTMLHSSLISAQSDPSVKELLLQTSALKSYHILRISQQLSALDGVTLRGYHPCSQTLLITYDSAKLTDPTIIISVVEHLNYGTCIQHAFFESLYAFIDRMEKIE